MRKRGPSHFVTPNAPAGTAGDVYSIALSANAIVPEPAILAPLAGFALLLKRRLRQSN